MHLTILPNLFQADNKANLLIGLPHCLSVYSYCLYCHVLIYINNTLNSCKLKLSQFVLVIHAYSCIDGIIFLHPQLCKRDRAELLAIKLKMKRAPT